MAEVGGGRGDGNQGDGNEPKRPRVFSKVPGISLKAQNGDAALAADLHEFAQASRLHLGPADTYPDAHAKAAAGYAKETGTVLFSNDPWLSEARLAQALADRNIKVKNVPLAEVPEVLRNTVKSYRVPDTALAIEEPRAMLDLLQSEQARDVVRQCKEHEDGVKRKRFDSSRVPESTPLSAALRADLSGLEANCERALGIEPQVFTAAQDAAKGRIGGKEHKRATPKGGANEGPGA